MLGLRLHCAVAVPAAHSRLKSVKPAASLLSSSGCPAMGHVRPVMLAALPLRPIAPAGPSTTGSYTHLRPARMLDGGSGSSGSGSSGGSGGGRPRSRRYAAAGGGPGRNPLAPLVAAINSLLTTIINIIAGAINTVSNALLSIWNLLAGNLWALLVLLGLYEIVQYFRGKPGIIRR